MLFLSQIAYRLRPVLRTELEAITCRLLPSLALRPVARRRLQSITAQNRSQTPFRKSLHD